MWWQRASRQAGVRPVFDRLDADIAHAMMSINAVKGVEVGDGFASVAQLGSEHRDLMSSEGFLSNHAGGHPGRDLLGTAAAGELGVKADFEHPNSRPHSRYRR